MHQLPQSSGEISKKVTSLSLFHCEKTTNQKSEAIAFRALLRTKLEKEKRWESVS